MFKKLVFTAFLITGCSFAPALAQTGEAAEKAAAIKELILVINKDDKAGEMIRLMTAQLNSLHDQTIEELIAAEPALSAAQKAELRKRLLLETDSRTMKFQEKLIAKLQFDEMIDQITAATYDKHYTLAEIKDLLAFYRTPTGQKTIALMPAILADTMQTTSERLLTKLPEVLEEIKNEDRREIVEQIKTVKTKPKSK